MKEYSEPRMHTAEHILNQAMVRMFGCKRAFSSHIEKKRSKCDYKFARALTAEETAELEKKVNEVIKTDLPVAEKFVSREEAAEKLDLGRLPEGTGETAELEKRVNEIIRAALPVGEAFVPKEEAAAKFDLGRLPEGTGETLRVILVGDYDACPCIGPHVQSTSEIGVFKIASSTFENGVLRIRFKLD